MTPDESYYDACKSYWVDRAPRWEMDDLDTDEFCSLLCHRWQQNDPYAYADFCAGTDNELSWSEELQLHLLALQVGGRETHPKSELIQVCLLEAYKKAVTQVDPAMTMGNTWFHDILALRRCSIEQIQAIELIADAAQRLTSVFPTSDASTLSAFAECYKELAFALVGEVSAETLVTASFRADSHPFPWLTRSVYRDVLHSSWRNDTASSLQAAGSIINRCSDELFAALAAIYAKSPGKALSGPWSIKHLGEWHRLFDESALLACGAVDEHKLPASRFCEFMMNENNERRSITALRLGWTPTLGDAYSRSPEELESKLFLEELRSTAYEVDEDHPVAVAHDTLADIVDIAA